MTDIFKYKFLEELNSLSLKLDECKLNQFYKYYEIMIQWNKFMNLTAITDMNEVITKHFVDSLSLIKAADNIATEKLQIIDVGTGAGFPGIPLKIAFPNLKITLMDSLNKRIKFLTEVIEQLELTNIEAIHSRAEDLGRNSLHREKYDYCVSRAVANLSTLSEYCLPFVKIGGSFIPYKSGKVESEVVEAKHAVFLLGGKIEEVETFVLPGTDAERTLVKIRKVNGTANKYPRKAGSPSKDPLK